MCTREELNTLLRELLRRIEQVAMLSANIQFDDEMKLNRRPDYLTCCDNNKNYLQNSRYRQIAAFHLAYLKYFVFACDPYADIAVPLSSSSLVLFITNILSRSSSQHYQFNYQHTSRTIVEFLQIVNDKLVSQLYEQYRTDLINVMKAMRLPYGIDFLTNARHETFRRNIEKQRHGVSIPVPVIRRSQKTQIIQLAPTSTVTHSAPMQPVRVATYEQHSYVGGGAGNGNGSDQQPQFMQMQSATTMETLCTTTSTTGVQQSQIPIITSTFLASPAPTNESYYQVLTTNGQPEFDPTLPVYLISSNDPITVEVVTSSDDVAAMATESTVEDDRKMTMDLAKSESITNVSGQPNQSQMGGHQLCAGCGKPIQDRYLLKALDMLWHEDCLKCGCCDCRLGEVGSTLYTKGNLMLCKRDYLRLFGNTGLCAACNKVIPAFEMVMRARNNVYHLECFACQQCNHRFCVGDRFYLCENKILCEYDYEERMVFASIGNHPMLKRHATNVSQIPPAYTKTSGGGGGGNGPAATSGTSSANSVGVSIQQSPNQTMLSMEQAAHHHQQQQQQQQQQQHQQQQITSSKLQHDDHNNNNNNTHGPPNGGSCGMATNSFNASLMKIPHST